MPIGQVNYEQQYVLRDTAGNIVWQGGGIGGCVYTVTSGEASTTINPGVAVIADTTDANMTLGYNQNPGTSDAGINKVSVLQVASAASVGYIGVAATTIPAGKTGTVMGPGTICTVRTTSTAIAIGAWVGGSGTAGLCAAVATATGGLHLGVCIKANATIATTTYAAGILISSI